MQPVRQM